MVKDQLKRAEPTYEDVMTARWVGRDHPYWGQVLQNDTRNGAIDRTEKAKDYRRLLEILACRERQLGIAVSLLSERDRERVGA